MTNSAEALTSNRLRQWAQTERVEIQNSLNRFAFERGLTAYDVADMFSLLLGEERPIYVEPAPDPRDLPDDLEEDMDVIDTNEEDWEVE